MTDQELAEIRARANAATPAPWEFYPPSKSNPQNRVYSSVKRPSDPIVHLLDRDQTANGRFIVHARTDIIQLLDEVEQLHHKLATIAGIAQGG